MSGNDFTWIRPLVAYPLGPCPTLPEVPKRSEAEVYSLIDCTLHAPTNLTIWHIGLHPVFSLEKKFCILMGEVWIIYV